VGPNANFLGVGESEKIESVAAKMMGKNQPGGLLVYSSLRALACGALEYGSCYASDASSVAVQKSLPPNHLVVRPTARMTLGVIGLCWIGS
jgi:hypothetical protein